MGITARRCEQAIAAGDPDQSMHLARLTNRCADTEEDMLTWPGLISCHAGMVYGVDLAAYLAGGMSSYDLWGTLGFEGGTCTELAGVVVGAEVAWDDLTGGWRTLNGYTGELTIAGEGGLCPAPSGAVLIAAGACCRAADSRHDHDSEPGRAGLTRRALPRHPDTPG